MDIQNKGFMIYRQKFEALEELTDAEIGMLVRALGRYAFGGEEPADMSSGAKILYKVMKPELDKDYEEYCAKVESVRKAREKRAEKAGRSADSDSDINTDINNEIITDINNEIINDINPKQKQKQNQKPKQNQKQKQNQNQNADECSDSRSRSEDRAEHGGIQQTSSEVIERLNMAAGTRYRGNTRNTLRLIQARLNEGFTKEDLIFVAEKMSRIWLGTEFEQYLRPETLFGSKFESYLNRPDRTDAQMREEKQLRERYGSILEWGNGYDTAGSITDDGSNGGFVPVFPQ